MNNQNTLYDLAREYERKKLLRSTRVDDYELFCYTQDTFFGDNTWDDVTKNHRGRLYYQGVPVNEPFRKIFNLNEQPETALEIVEKRMLQESYEVYDKANGHLFIVSCFVDEENNSQVVMHTKGSLPTKDNELLLKDIEKFVESIGGGERLANLCESLPVATYMFEAIVDHDKHTLYEKQCEAYDITNGFVLLGANIMVPDYDGELKWFECGYNELQSVANVLGCPLVKKYDRSSLDKDINSWFEHKDVEGYIIHFSNGDRVKIKTKEYWMLRFRKDLNAENILRMFNAAGFDRIHLKLPEEVAHKVQEKLTQFYDFWYRDIHVNTNFIDDYLYKNYDSKEISEEDFKRSVSKDKTLTTQQKTYIFSLLNNKTLDLSRSKVTRSEFVKHLFSDSELMSDLQKDIEEIVDNIN